jgi:BTB/POZ domain-containing protein 7
VLLILQCYILTVPDAATMAQLLKREQKLRQSPLVLRALALPLTSRHLVSSQVRLRVVREFNLPDSTAQLLEVNSLVYLFIG